MDPDHAPCVRPRQRIMLGSAHCFVFFLSVAATITRCADSAASGAAGPPARGIRGGVLCHRSNLPACHGTSRLLDPGMCGLFPFFLSAELLAGSVLRCASLRGGAPDGPWGWSNRGRGRRDAYSPGTSASDAWAPGDRAIASDSYARYQDQGTDSRMQLPGSDAVSYRGSAEWLRDLLDEEPDVARVVGALAGRSIGERGLVFSSPTAFAAAAKTVAFLVGSAARAPREMAWRKVRRSNPALGQRLGEEGYRLLQSCGYVMVRHTSRQNEAFYVLRGVSPRTLEAMERLLLGAADHGQAWISREYSMWLEGARDYAADGWNEGRMGGLGPDGTAWRRHAHAGQHYPARQSRARPDAMPVSAAVYDGGKGSSGVWAAEHGVAGRNLEYGRAFVQQRTAALLRARQSLLGALEAEANTRNRTVAGLEQEEPSERDGGTHGASQRALDTGDDGLVQQLFEGTLRALTCTSSAAERMLRSRALAAKRGGVGAGGVNGGADSGEVSMMHQSASRERELIQHLLGTSREQLREVALCQQRRTAAAHGLKREVSRHAEARRVCAEAQRLLQLNSQREDSALLRCQELQVVFLWWCVVVCAWISVHRLFIRLDSGPLACVALFCSRRPPAVRPAVLE